MERNIEDFLGFMGICAGLFILGFLLSWAIWGKDRTLECNVKVDGKIYKCSTAPKISSDKVIKFLNGKRYVEIPIDKEVIITFDK
jgi:hypothetical protein